MEEITLHDRSFRPYLTPGAIRTRVLELAHHVSQDYSKASCLAVPILQGSFLFAADLLRELTFFPEIHFIKVSSYGDGLKSSAALQWQLDLPESLVGRDLILIEDILGSGFTIESIRKACHDRGAVSVKVVTLLYKPDAFQGSEAPEYVGFSIPNDFVVGYGLDYAQLGRNLKGIYQVVE